MTKLYAQEKQVFDINKLTVVGSPTITSDGVLSKTSESTYLKISNNIVKQLEGEKSWRIDFKGVMPNDNAYQNITGQSAGVVGMLNIGSINGSGNFFVQIYAEDGTNKAIYVPGGVANNYGKEYIGYASYNGNDTYTIALSVDNGTTWKTSSATWDKTVYFGGNDLKVGYRLLTGSLDLTAFKIYVDGELVYSPTKSVYALERRKPKVWNKGQFTIIGNPSISDSGVFTCGNDKASYIKVPFDNTLDSFSLDIEIDIKDSTQKGNYLGHSNNISYGFMDAHFNGAGATDFRLRVKDDSDNVQLLYMGNSKYQVGTEKINLSFTGTQYILTRTNANGVVNKHSVDSTFKPATNFFSLGNSDYTGIPLTTINLKKITNTSDNKLVFDGGAETYVYDASKFTVVGSPTITEYGVLSKTSESTYLKISNNIVKQLEGEKSWRIDFKGVMPNDNAYQNITGQSAGVVGMLNIGSINGSGNFFVQIYAEDGTNKAIYVPGGVANNYGKEYIGYASYNGNDTYTIALSVDNGTTWKTSSATWDKTVYFGGNDLKVGYRLLTGSLDLPSLSIAVDGKEIFTGAKEKFYAMRGM